MNPRPRDFIGAATLMIVLMGLVALIFVATWAGM
jgi:hypothetical protein